MTCLTIPAASSDRIIILPPYSHPSSHFHSSLYSSIKAMQERLVEEITTRVAFSFVLNNRQVGEGALTEGG